MAPTRRQVMLGGIAAMAMKSVTTPFSQFLRLAFFRSPNYQAGVSGWTINQDGSAEFNNITIRNGQIISGVFLLYSASPPAKGNLVLAFAPVTGGTDSVGNVYPQGFNFGVWSASTGALLQHFGINTSGDLFLVNSSGKVIVHGHTSDGSLDFYNTSGESLNNLINSIAPAQGTDSAGNTVYAGVTSYTTAANAIAQLFSGALNIGTPGQMAGTGGATPGLVGLASGGNPGVVRVDSGLTATGDSDSFVDVRSKNAQSAISAVAQRNVTLAGPLALSVEGSTPLQLAAALLYSDSSGLARMLAGLAGDTNAYFLGALHLFAKNVSQVINSTTPAAITGLTCTLGIGTYRIRARLICTQGLTAQSQNFRFTGSGGLAVSAGRLTATSLGSASAVIGVSTVTALATDLASGAFAAGVTWVTNIDGWYQVSTAGTIALQASEGAAGNSFTVVDGTLDVEPAI